MRATSTAYTTSFSPPADGVPANSFFWRHLREHYEYPITRKLVKIHTWLALAVLIPLLVICFTGSISVFKHEIDSLLMPNKVRIKAVEPGRISLGHLVSNIHGESRLLEAPGLQQ